MFIAPDVILSESQRRVAPERMALIVGGCRGLLVASRLPHSPALSEATK